MKAFCHLFLTTFHYSSALVMKNVIHVVNDWFKERDEMFFVDAIKALEHCWEKM